MGLILFPFFIAALIIFIRAIFQFIPLIKGDELTNQTIFIGIAIPILIVGCTIFYWILKEKVYIFEPFFSFIFSLIFLPMIIRLFQQYILPFQNTIDYHSILTLWIITGGLLTIPLFIYLTDFLTGNGVKIFH